MKHFKSGRFIPTNGYKAFQPELINRSYRFDDDELLPLLEKAMHKLGELNAFSELVPDVDHFIRMHVVKEATVSSRIEGTQTNMEEAMLYRAEVEPEKRDDWQEVHNYVAAMNNAIEQMKTLPLSSRLLKEAHRRLLDGVRGERKMPGEFRRSQNWIGGATLRDAAFVPPVQDDVERFMGDLENFLHNDRTGLPHVLKIALAHYQFETIHPFLDGNGRIGRLLITLYFIHAGVLRNPVLYLSDFFERNRAAYYDNLTAVRTQNDLRRWMKFFLVGTMETVDKATDGLRRILALKKDCETNRLPRLGKKMGNAQTLLQHLFLNPVVRPNEVAKHTGLSAVAAYRLIDDFETLKILRQHNESQRNRIYIFEEYFDVFR